MVCCVRRCRYIANRKEAGTLDIKTRRKMVAILRVLQDSPTPLGSQRIAEMLLMSGVDLSERAVRNYLAQADELGWTENLGRRGRRLTPQGSQEIEGALVVDKVGFVSARVDALAFQMDFDLSTLSGSVIVNISCLSPRDLHPALHELIPVFDANLGMGRLLGFGVAGERIGDFRVPRGCVAIATVCSVSINALLLHAHIPVTSRFGGLVQLEKTRPRRFTQIITYDGSSLDPLEIFIRGHMTTVADAAHTGAGILGASFREAPAVTAADVRRIADLSEAAGLGGTLAIGNPGQPLLDIPVGQGRVGIVVCGGLNPIAAVHEAGIAMTSTAMSTLCDFSELFDYRDLELMVSSKGA